MADEDGDDEFDKLDHIINNSGCAKELELSKGSRFQSPESEQYWSSYKGQVGFNEIFENEPPLASGRGLCEIDRVQFRVTQKNFKIWEVLVWRSQTAFCQMGKLELSV